MEDSNKYPSNEKQKKLALFGPEEEAYCREFAESWGHTAIWRPFPRCSENTTAQGDRAGLSIQKTKNCTGTYAGRPTGENRSGCLAVQIIL